jgi:hypothetical protein
MHLWRLAVVYYCGKVKVVNLLLLLHVYTNLFLEFIHINLRKKNMIGTVIVFSPLVY